MKLNPEVSRSYATASTRIGVAAVLARASLADSAKHVLTRAYARRRTSIRRAISNTIARIAWTLLGDKSAAIKSLSIYLAANPNAAAGFNSDNNWRWRSIADDPRFQRLVSTGKQ